jgi:hypothetical protein
MNKRILICQLISSVTLPLINSPHSFLPRKHRYEIHLLFLDALYYGFSGAKKLRDWLNQGSASLTFTGKEE